MKVRYFYSTPQGLEEFARNEAGDGLSYLSAIAVRLPDPANPKVLIKQLQTLIKALRNVESDK